MATNFWIIQVKRNHTHQDPDMKRIATNKTCKNLGSK